MPKLNWSRASEHSFDPARYQRSDRILAPDEVAKPKSPQRKPAKSPSPAKLRKRAIKEEKKRNKVAARAFAAEQQKRKAEANAERRRVAIERQKVKAKARQAAFEAYMKSPEYEAKLAREQAATAKKRKSHLQVWVEKAIRLRADRSVLNRRWRADLLKRATDKHE